MEHRDDSERFRGELLLLARQARGFTQPELARAVNIAQAFVSLIEHEQRAPTADVIERFSQSLRFPRSFFYQDDPIIGTGIGEVFHRRRKSLGSKETSQIHAWMNITTFATRRLLRAVEWPSVELQPWSIGVEVNSEEEAAEALRAKWYVPSGPIQSVCTILDRAGVLSIPTAFPTLEVDAIGQWPSDLPPLIFANINVPQDRLRFTLMHEIGHLVLHQRSALLEVTDRIELEANRFASAFLMPQREVKPQLRQLTISRLTQLKRHWRVSMAALIMRAKQLQTITPAEEKSLWTEMSRNGWRKREPASLDVHGEVPGGRYRELLQLHRVDLGYSTKALGAALNLYQEDVHERILLPEPGLRLVGS